MGSSLRSSNLRLGATTTDEIMRKSSRGLCHPSIGRPMEDATVATGGPDVEVPEVQRLSDFSKVTNLEERLSFLSFVDTLLLQFKFHVYASRKFWGKYEALVLALASASVIMGAWDYGIDELSSGGDWSRGGLFGEESGFLHLEEWSLMLSLLTMMAWASALLLMWTRYPIMRENLVFLVVASLSVQLGPYLLSFELPRLSFWFGNFRFWRSGNGESHHDFLGRICRPQSCY